MPQGLRPRAYTMGIGWPALTKPNMSYRIILAILIAGLCQGQTPGADQRMEWYRHDKFGMFIHLGAVFAAGR